MVFDLYLVTGGRKEEVARLTWGDVNLERRLITFSGTKSRKERQVWISDLLLEDLQKFKGKENERIFHHDGDWAYSMYRYYAHAAGLTDPEKRKLHVLRHTCAYLMLSNGTDPVTVQQVLGHASVKTTLDRYGHSTPARKVEAGQVVDTALRKILSKG
jgi:integrase